MKFKSPELLRTALKHKSLSESGGRQLDHNERLEFLGDAVIQLSISDLLYGEIEQLSEGQMTKLRSALVNQTTLARAFERLDLTQGWLEEAASAVSANQISQRVMAGTFEAICGAIFLDQGFLVAKEWIHENLYCFRNEGLDALKDYKTELQEIIQAQAKETPVYEVILQDGPVHDPQFTAQVTFLGSVQGIGQGKSKKLSEQEAARSALKNYRKDPV